MNTKTNGAFQTSDSNMPGYYIVQWTGNAYTLQGKYTCHAFDPSVIISEGELVCPAKFMTSMRKPSYWCHDPYEAIPFMVKLKQLMMPFVQLIQYNNKTNKLISYFKEYAFTNPRLLSKQYHQIILDQIESRENLNHGEYAEVKIITI